MIKSMYDKTDVVKFVIISAAKNCDENKTCNKLKISVYLVIYSSFSYLQTQGCGAGAAKEPLFAQSRSRYRAGQPWLRLRL